MARHGRGPPNVRSRVTRVERGRGFPALTARPYISFPTQGTREGLDDNRNRKERPRRPEDR